MGIEIERKFLVIGDEWRRNVSGIHYAQGYLARGNGNTVRVRLAGTNAFLTIKGPVSGISRMEFEYPIPFEEARQILSLSEGSVIEKTRYKIPFGVHTWEVDEFRGKNIGLLIAEVELSDPGEEVILPAWIGREVSGDQRYYNSNLSLHPYAEWSDRIE